MSTSNINNGKRHVRDRAYYGGLPNQKKRIKHIKKEENTQRITIKYNLCAVSTALLIANQLEGSEEMKLFIILLALCSGFQYFKEGEE